MSETRHEHAATAVSGWLFLPIWIAFFAGTLVDQPYDEAELAMALAGLPSVPA